jgi:hypothetical protein
MNPNEERVIRPSTQEDFLQYFGDLPPYRVRSLTGLRDGRILAIAGVGFPPGGAPILFMDIEPEAREYKMIICKTALRFMNMIKRLNIPLIVATIQQDNQVFKDFASRFGFKDTGVVVEGEEIWRWDISNSDTNMTAGYALTRHVAQSVPLSG